MYVNSIDDCSKVQGSWSLYARYLLVAAIKASHERECVLQLCWNTVEILNDGFRPSVVHACSRCSLQQKALSLAPLPGRPLATQRSFQGLGSVTSSHLSSLNCVCTPNTFFLGKQHRTRGSLAFASGGWLRGAR